MKVGDLVVVVANPPARVTGEAFPFHIGDRMRVREISEGGYNIRVEGDDAFWHIVRFQVLTN